MNKTYWKLGSSRLTDYPFNERKKKQNIIVFH